ncbi:hypothetical protein SKAU_G00383120 [Synaphobranchus kaupii]|uniref:ATP-dependent RNA helicase DHX30 n=1 Tax=Synaphobranchus kaupii TaxID=118154 RepID=A0A9Q1EE39_SYNKA|nr:hypothetical protein SKAU_G00383120 [Synaphobranchus kaupii]
MAQENGNADSVQCPVCLDDFEASVINAHLDNCLLNDAKSHASSTDGDSATESGPPYKKCRISSENASHNSEASAGTANSESKVQRAAQSSVFTMFQRNKTPNLSERNTLFSSKQTVPSANSQCAKRTVLDEKEFMPTHRLKNDGTATSDTSTCLPAHSLLDSGKPLAELMRPNTIEEYFGQNKVVGENTLIRTLLDSQEIPSLILWGPPGCGKTTLAHIIASRSKKSGSARFVKLSATSSSTSEVREVIKQAQNELRLCKRKTILFIDEIHRFNKSQQDTFLPHVECGTVTLIGATTENPSFQVNAALLSRCRVLVLEKLSVEAMDAILRRAAAALGLRVLGEPVVGGDGDSAGSAGSSELRVLIEQKALDTIAYLCDGDARTGLNGLQLAVQARISAARLRTTKPGGTSQDVLVQEDHVKEGLQRSHILYDKAGEEHYNCISALHKSMRGSHTNAALYWLGRMLEGGEDPLYVARRLVRFASEDVGLADPGALPQAVAAFQACHFIGMPECEVILAQCVVYLARAPKSVEVYKAYASVKACVRNQRGPLPPVPLHLRNAPTRLMKDLGYAKGYKYNPSFSEPVEQDYLPEELRGKTCRTVTRTGQNSVWISRCRNDFERTFGTKARTVPNHGAAQTRLGHQDYLKEFPEPKQLLNQTLTRSLGISDLSQYIQYHCSEGTVKRATLTIQWPEMIEVEGFGSRKVDAERRAAAAACHRLRELGVLEPGNQILGRTLVQELSGEEEEDRGTAVFPQAPLDRTQGSPNPPRSSQGGDDVANALSLFPKPKAMLTQVIQVATSSSSLRELVQYETRGGKVKTCQLTLRWPEEMTFVTSGRRRLEAERRAAALACLRLKEMGLLGENNKPLTHAMYHKEELHELGQRERRPCTLELPEHLENRLADYLRQYPVAEEMQKLWDEEEERAGQPLSEEDEDEVIVDAITGRPYRPLPQEEAERLSHALQMKWQEVDPDLGVELPVDAHRERVVSAVEAERVTVIAGETGCGKTTRIPRFLLEGRVHAGDGARCNVLVTQPRRISAVSVAHRVAHELGPELRHCVGYQVRLESRPPEHSGGALLFLTVGVLLRKLQGNAALEGVSHVVVDEVHERDVNTDLLLALLRAALRDNPGLRVVLMSATGDTARLSRYFGGCQVLRVPGFMHPVQERYLEEVLRDMGRSPPLARPRSTGKEKEDDDAAPDLDVVADVIEHIHTRGVPGAVLCFLPGWQDIRVVQKSLEERPAFQRNGSLILPLHSSMGVSEQQTVFQHPPAGQRKIVLATNIAETSITIDDIVHVVDVGAQKEQRYDPRTKVSCLDTVWISRSNVTQRRGRAGRCQPGHSYHLFPRGRLETMPDFPIPEILRTPLESLVVQAKIHSPHSKAVDFLSQVMDSPDKATVQEAVMNLQEIGVLDGAESLTPLGERIACLSCDPRLGKVLVLAALFRCALPLLSITACLTRDPFLNSMQNRGLINEAKGALSGSSCSDHLVFSRVVQGWRRVQQVRSSRQEFLDDYTLSGSSLRFIHGLIQQFSDNLHEASLVSNASDCLRLSSPPNQFSQEDQLVKAVLLAGLYPNLIQVKKGLVTKGGRFRPDSLAYRTRGGPVLLHRSTINRGEENLPSRWLTFFTAVKSNGRVFIRDSSSVHPLSLLLLTDCDITESVSGERVEVSLGGRSLVRCELSVQSWNLLWELRMSLHAMLQRRLRANRRSPDPDANVNGQDHQLIALLVELLNSTQQETDFSPDDTDAPEA